mgnify:CR=1 FL=1
MGNFLRIFMRKKGHEVKSSLWLEGYEIKSSLRLEGYEVKSSLRREGYEVRVVYTLDFIPEGDNPNLAVG